MRIKLDSCSQTDRTILYMTTSLAYEWHTGGGKDKASLGYSSSCLPPLPTLLPPPVPVRSEIKLILSSDRETKHTSCLGTVDRCPSAPPAEIVWSPGGTCLILSLHFKLFNDPRNKIVLMAKTQDNIRFWPGEGRTRPSQAKPGRVYN